MRENPCTDERLDERDEAGSMAARVGDAFRAGDTFAVAGKLGESVRPSICGAVRG